MNQKEADKMKRPRQGLLSDKLDWTKNKNNKFEDNPKEFGNDTELLSLTGELIAILGDDRKFETEQELHALLGCSGADDHNIHISPRDL